MYEFNEKFQSLYFKYNFRSLLPLRRKLIYCPSQWVSECNNRIQALNEFCRFRSGVSRFLKLPQRGSFLQSILQKSCLVGSSGQVCLNMLYFIHTEIFASNSAVWKRVLDFTSTNQRGEASFSHVKKLFRPITNHGLSELCFRGLFRGHRGYPCRAALTR